MLQDTIIECKRINVIATYDYFCYSHVPSYYFPREIETQYVNKYIVES